MGEVSPHLEFQAEFFFPLRSLMLGRKMSELLGITFLAFSWMVHAETTGEFEGWNPFLCWGGGGNLRVWGGDNWASLMRVDKFMGSFYFSSPPPTTPESKPQDSVQTEFAPNTLGRESFECRNQVPKEKAFFFSSSFHRQKFGDG